jgi:predicted transcriptional regulator of viral defense system
MRVLYDAHRPQSPRIAIHNSTCVTLSTELRLYAADGMIASILPAMNGELARISARQGNVFLRCQALDCGYTSDDVVRLSSTAWRRVRRGAYAEREIVSGADERGLHRLRVHAVMAATRRDVVVSGVSAAVVHGLDLWQPALSRVQLTSETDASRLESDVHHHHAALLSADVEIVDGLKVTSIERTLADVARTSTFEQGVVTADSALRHLERSSTDLRPLVDRYCDWPGGRRLAEMFNFADGRADNLAESRTRVLLHTALLPPMTPQVCIYDERFVLVAIADLAALGRGTLIEFDGRAKYGMDGQDVRTQLISEKMRGDRLGDLGYELARAMWEDLSNGSAVRRVRAALDRAAMRPRPRGYYRLSKRQHGRLEPVGPFVRP